MMYRLTIKRIMSLIVIATLIGSMLLQGCSGSIKGSSSSSKDIMTVEYNNFSMEFDYTNHTFVIRSNDGDKDKSWEGSSLLMIILRQLMYIKLNHGKTAMCLFIIQ